MSPPVVVTTTAVAPPPPASPCITTAEALALERTVGSSIPMGYTTGAANSHLTSDSVHFPMEAGFRMQIASSAWNDNKSISDFIYWGQQQRWRAAAIYGDPTGDATLIQSPWLQIAKLDHGIDDSLGYAGRSRIDNVEANDRIRLTPYDPGWNVNWLWGTRYLRFSDDFTLAGSDVASNNSESLAYQAKNSLIGMQSGLQMLWGADRLQLSTEAKVGLYANFYAEHGTDTGSGTPAITPYDGAQNGCDLAMVFEASALLRYRLVKELWLRAGYQYYCLTGMALAPRQLDGWRHNGVVALDGASLGVELDW